MGLFEQFPYTNYHEKNLQWLMEHVGEYDDQIKALQDKDAELQQEIDDIDVRPAVDDAIQELVDSGYIEDLVVDQINYKTRNLNIKRLGRLLDDHGYQGRNSVIGGQSICYDGNKYYSCGESSAGQTIAVWATDGTLSSYNNTFTQLGHANSMTALGSYLYIADGTNANLHVVDKSSLTFVQSIDLSGVYSSVFAVDEDDGKLYVLGMTAGSPGVRTVSVMENNVPVPLCTFIVYNRVNQGFAVKDGYAYSLMNQSNMIYKISLSSGNIEMAYYLPSGDGWNPSGEYEDMFKKDGKICLAACLYYNQIASSAQLVALGQIFETDIEDILEKQLTYQYMQSETMPRLTCSSTNTYSFNPENDFTTVEEACYIANYLRKADITVQGITVGFIRLIGGFFKIDGPSGNRVVTRTDIENARVMMTKVSTGDLNVIGGYLYLTSAGINGNALFSRAKVDLNECYFNNTVSITVRCSQVNINWVAAAVNGSLTVSVPEDGGTRLRIYSRVRDYIMLLSKLTGSPIAYDCVRMSDGRALNFKHNPANNTFTETIYNDVTYNQFEAQSGGTYRVRKTDNTYTSLSASDYIYIDAAY